MHRRSEVVNQRVKYMWCGSNNGDMGEDDKSFSERKKDIEDERQRIKKERKGEPTVDELEEKLQPIVEKAKSRTVTAERLVGQENFFHNIYPFLEEDEQPHFLFPLTKGVFAEGALIVESAAEREELLSNQDGGSVVMTDHYIRIHSSSGEWTIPYTSIVSVDQLGHPALHIQTSGRTYYIQIAGTKFDLAANVNQAARYIRDKQAERSQTKTDGKSPIEKLETLSELHEQGKISKAKYEDKKEDLLEEI